MTRRTFVRNPEQAAKWYESGWPLRKIADVERVSVSTVRRDLSDLGVEFRNCAQIMKDRYAGNKKTRPNIEGDDPKLLIEVLNEMDFFEGNEWRRILIDRKARDLLVKALKVLTIAESARSR